MNDFGNLRQLTSCTLLTDLYQLTMAQGYFFLNIHDTLSCFHLFFRKKPFGGEYAVACGLQEVITFITHFQFSQSDIAYLASLKAQDGSRLFKKEFLNYLSTLKISCDIDAVEEGTLVFPYEPILRVKGPLLQAQLLETSLLNWINFSTLIATKASRVKLAAEQDFVVEFGVRRAQGPNGALLASRAAYIGGADASSCLLAGKMFDIPVMGTQAHSWVMAHEDEIKAFENFAMLMPSAASLLIDTYDTKEGIEKAIKVAKESLARGVRIQAVRLDSGDLIELSKHVRQRLNQEGLSFVKIMATSELDENRLFEMKQQGAQVDIWGVGTHLVTSRDQPALDGVYKLAYIEKSRSQWGGVLKISDTKEKTTDPGILQIKRFFCDSMAMVDVLIDEKISKKEKSSYIHRLHPSLHVQIDPHWKSEDLLVPILKEGQLVYSFPSLSQIKAYHRKQAMAFSRKIISLHPTQQYPLYLEKELFDRKQDLLEKYPRF